MASTSKESNEKELVETSVNLFTEPHNRMKELVSWPLTEAAEFSDVHELEPSLQAIYEAMWELKTHEIIENTVIMQKVWAILLVAMLMIEPASSLSLEVRVCCNRCFLFWPMFALCCGGCGFPKHCGICRPCPFLAVNSNA